MLQILENTRYIIILREGVTEQKISHDGKTTIELVGNMSTPTFYEVRVTNDKTSVVPIKLELIEYSDYFNWIILPHRTNRSFMRVGRYIYDITDHFYRAKFIGNCVLLKGFNCHEFNWAVSLIRKFESQVGVKSSELFNYAHYVKKSQNTPYDNRYLFEEISRMRTRMTEEQAKVFKEEYEPKIGKAAQRFKDTYLKMLTRYLETLVFKKENIINGVVKLNNKLCNVEVLLNDASLIESDKFVLENVRHEKLRGTVSICKAIYREVK